MTLRQAAEAAGTPYPTAARYIQQGLIRPDSYVGRQGAPVVVSDKDFRELSVLAKLRNTLSLQELREALDFLRSLGHNPLSEGRFLVIGGEPGSRRLIKVCADKHEAVEVIGKQAGQLTLIPLDNDVKGSKQKRA